MSRFIITITPDNAAADDAASAQTTVRVDTSSGHTRITELTVRAADGGGLAPADLPAVDLELLIQALAAPSAIRALPAEAEAEVVQSGWGARAGGTPVATPAEMAEAVEPSEVAAQPSGAAPRRGTKRAAAGTRAAGTRAAGSRRAAGKAAGRKAAGRTAAKKAVRKAAGRAASGAETGARTGRTAAAAKVGGAKAAARGRRATAPEESGTRAYRRMPEPADVLAEYARSGSITKLAEHYDVPRHTANGWARRLRGLGYTIGRS